MAKYPTLSPKLNAAIEKACAEMERPIPEKEKAKLVVTKYSSQKAKKGV